MTSRTQQALQWLKDNPGQTQAAASRMFNLSQSVLSRAMWESKRPRCPECGHYVKVEK